LVTIAIALLSLYRKTVNDMLTKIKQTKKTEDKKNCTTLSIQWV